MRVRLGGREAQFHSWIEGLWLLKAGAMRFVLFCFVFFASV